MINSFRGKHRFLSNFYLWPVEFDGYKYQSVEHAYQAAKTTNHQYRWYFRELAWTPGEAKKFGQRLELRPDWELVKLDVMYQCLKSKFSYPKLKAQLLATGDEELVEGNNWGDKYWGICNGVGENHLGKLLMRIREELRNENSNTEE